MSSMKVKLRIPAQRPTAQTPTNENEIKKKLKISKTGIKVVDQLIMDPTTLKETCQKLLVTLTSDPSIGPFLELVSSQDYPVYYELIESPISIHEIDEKLNSNAYHSLNEFKQDVMLMFNNCFKFNQKNSEIYIVAQELKRKFEAALEGGPSGSKRSLKSSGLLNRLSVPNSMSSGQSLLDDPGTHSKTPAGTKSNTVMDTPAKKKVVLKKKTETPSKQPGQEIFSLIKQGVLEPFKKAVNELSDPNTLFKTSLFNSSFTWGIIHACAYYGQQRMLDYLITSRQANIELEDTWFGGRALAWASFGAHFDVCKRLLELGALKDATNKHGQTAYDLINDKTKPWQELFNVKEPAAIQPKRIAALKEKAHEPTTPKVIIKTRTQTPLAPIITSKQSIDEQIKQNVMNTVRSAKRIDPRKLQPDLSTPVPSAALSRQLSTPNTGQFTGAIPSGVQQQKNFALTAQYSAFVSTLAKQPQNTHLIDSIVIHNSDVEYSHTINISANDISENIYGNLLIVPSGIQKIDLTFGLKKKGLIVQGYYSFNYKPRPDFSQTILEQIQVRDDSCSVILSAPTVVLEFVVSSDTQQHATVVILSKQ